MSDIGWGIIGVPNGFQHISEGITANSTISIVDKRFCKEEFLEEPLFAVIYDTAIVEGSNNRQLMTYFVQYNFAREVEKDRLGSFYGSYVVLAGIVPEDIDCYEVIMSLLENLSNYNKGFFINDNNRFKKDYFNDRDNYDLNSDNFKEAVDLISEHTVRIKSITQKYENRKDVVVFSDDVTNVFLNSMELYGIYSTIYTADSKAYCEYIKSKEGINCKEVVDLEKETLDIKEARQREIDRIKREQQEQKEKEIKEQERIQKEEQERIRLHEEEVQNIFHRMEVLFLFFEESLSLVDLIEEYKSGTYDFEHLKDTYEALEANANEAKRISNIFEERKLELLAELKKIRSINQQPKTELKLATEAAEGYPNLKPTISPTKISNGSNGIKPQGTGGVSPNYHNNNQSDTNNFSVKHIIVGISSIIIVFASIATIYFFFFNKESEPAKSSLTLSTTQDININNGYTSTYQDSSANMDTEYIETDLESDIGNSVSSVSSLNECNERESLLDFYTVSTIDIKDAASNLRFDDEKIVSNIVDNILAVEGDSNLVSNEDKRKFKQMLMSCNDELNYKKHNPNNLGSNKLLTVMEGSEIKYSKTGYFK